MSRASVRDGIKQYLTNAGIASLGAVFAHPPKYTSEQEFYQMEAPGSPSGAVIFIHLQGQSERRAAMGGPTSGKKFRLYEVVLICFFRSKKDDTEAVGEDNDAFIEALTNAIQASRDAGGSVFQWGEGDALYGTDIRVRSDFPRPIRQQASQVYSTVEVYALEQLTT